MTNYLVRQYIELKETYPNIVHLFQTYGSRKVKWWHRDFCSHCKWVCLFAYGFINSQSYKITLHSVFLSIFLSDMMPPRYLPPLLWDDAPDSLLSTPIDSFWFGFDTIQCSICGRGCSGLGAVCTNCAQRHSCPAKPRHSFSMSHETVLAGKLCPPCISGQHGCPRQDRVIFYRVPFFTDDTLSMEQIICPLNIVLWDW
jgi:hypothetical protein